MADYIIVTPKYLHNSNGIKTLHKICHTINMLGGNAKLMFIASNDPNCQDVIFHDASWTNPEWNTPPLQESERHLIDTAYVLYPDVMLGNPLNSQKVIRYFGNREGYCNGKKISFGPHDFTVAHSVSIMKDADFILYNSEIHPAFHADGALPPQQRRLDLTYVGKGYLYGRVGIVQNTLYISREWPTTQDQLGLLMRQTRVFYTWDSWTSTNVEAILCGAVPYFLRYEPWTEADLDGCEIGTIPRLDDNKKDFDPVRFAEQRQNMIRRIAELTASWDVFVRNFMQRVDKHFIERNLQQRAG